MDMENCNETVCRDNTIKISEYVFLILCEKSGAKGPSEKSEMQRHERRKKWPEFNEIVHRYIRNKIRKYVFRIILETMSFEAQTPRKI